VAGGDPHNEAVLNVYARLNLRDLGGLVSRDGRQVASGLVFRSGALYEPTAQEVPALERLGLVEVFDLRTAAERAELAMPWPAATVNWLDVMGPNSTAAPARLRELLADPVQANAEMGDGRAAELFADAYRQFVNSPQGLAAYSCLLHGIAHARGPVVFHCTAGKDRTGWAAAVLLELLEVPRHEVMADYLRTNEVTAPTFDAYREAYASVGGDVGVLSAALVADAAYLAAAFDEMEATWGDVSFYVSRGLGLSDDDVALIRERLLVEA
jgi:protein-tyrosine phosphatase